MSMDEVHTAVVKSDRFEDLVDESIRHLFAPETKTMGVNVRIATVQDDDSYSVFNSEDPDEDGEYEYDEDTSRKFGQFCRHLHDNPADGFWEMTQTD